MVLDLKLAMVSICMVAWTAACGPAEAPVPTPTVVPTPVPLRAQISPALEPLLPAVRVCADQNTHLALFVEAFPARANPPTVVDVFFFVPSELTTAEHTFALGKERLVVIVNPENGVHSLSTTIIRDIFSGRIRRWNSLPGAATSGDGLIQLWSYASSDSLHAIFTDAVFESGRTISPDFSLAPGPAAMLEAVAEGQNAIGYLPQGWLDDSVRAVELEEQSVDRWEMPILAGVIEEPGPAVASFLGCLQTGEGQRIIQERYPGLE